MVDFHNVAMYALSSFSSFLPQWLPGGKFQGDEYIVCNPKRGDKTPGSFKINVVTGQWSDFASKDQGGDPISLYAYLNDIKQSEAAITLAGMCGAGQSTMQPEKASRKPPEQWEIVFPVPETAPKIPDSFSKNVNGEWVQFPFKFVWPYTDEAGRVLFYVVRIETAEGKETPPLSLWRNGSGVLKWRFKMAPGLRPIFNLDLLKKFPQAEVFVVEGEKCAKVFQTLLNEAGFGSKFVVTTWPGGGNGVDKANFSQLSGRKVVLWPDFDLKKYKSTHKNAGQIMPTEEQPGYTAMIDVAKRLTDCAVKIVYPVPDKPDTWDAADAILKDGWGVQQVFAFIKEHLRPMPATVKTEVTNEKKNKPANSDRDHLPVDPDEPPPDYDEAPVDSWPFRCLGYNHGVCYYLPNGSKQVYALKPDGHSKNNLLFLAKQSFWERAFPSKEGPAWSMAVNAMMRASENAGVYDPSRLRGRGGWYDKGRAVLHLGDRLMVDGVDIPICDVDSKYIYEAGPSLEHSGSIPLGNKEAYKLQEVVNSLFWERPIHSKLLAGWCVIAPICGALQHRPHVWLTAKPGAGKSWVLSHIIKPCLGKFVLPAKSNTSEAGIRQMLFSDAMPVMIDEFEGEDADSQKRVQAILDLARQAFSDDEGSIIKGGQQGKAVHYTIRSTFFMSSVGVNLYRHADETRISVLSLDEPFDRDGISKSDHFAALEKLVTETLTPEWCEAFRSRIFSLIPVIRHNASIFARAASKVIGKQRSGDQLGALLAGAFALTSTGKVDYDKAKALVEKWDWSEQRETSERSDDIDCLNCILQHQYRISPSVEKTIHEMLDETKNLQAYQWGSGTELQAADYTDHLRRIGIRIETDGLIWISDSAGGIKRILEKTPFARTWSRILKRMPGAQSKGSMRFIGTPQKATGIPWDVIGNVKDS